MQYKRRRDGSDKKKKLWLIKILEEMNYIEDLKITVYINASIKFQMCEHGIFLNEK